MERPAGQSPLGRLQQQSARSGVARCWRRGRAEAGRPLQPLALTLHLPHPPRLLPRRWSRLLRPSPRHPLGSARTTLVAPRHHSQQLRDEDAGVGVLGDRRRPLDEITLHHHQLLLGLLLKRGQLG